MSVNISGHPLPLTHQLREDFVHASSEGTREVRHRGGTWPTSELAALKPHDGFLVDASQRRQLALGQLRVPAPLQQFKATSHNRHHTDICGGVKPHVQLFYVVADTFPTTHGKSLTSTHLTVASEIAVMQNAGMTERQRTGRAVQLARKIVGWSQLELAGRAGVNKETIVRLEKGENTRYQTVVTVFDLLNAEDASAVREALAEAFPHSTPQILNRLGVSSAIAENPIDSAARLSKIAPSNTQQERESEGASMIDDPDPRRDPDARAILGVYESFKRQVGGDERLVRELVRAMWSEADRLLDSHIERNVTELPQRKEAGKK